jgi:hypothetical protein
MSARSCTTCMPSSAPASCRMSSGTLRVPRVVEDPSSAWLGEGATITPSDGEVDDVTLEAKRLTALVKFTDELDEDWARSEASEAFGGPVEVAKEGATYEV